MARIIIIGPEGRVERELVPHNTLGRHPENTHQVLDRIVSKEHCHIDERDGRYVLRDLGSLNGTFINGERVDERVLNTGDEITLGSTRIIYQGDEAPSFSPSPASQTAAGIGAQPGGGPRVATFGGAAGPPRSSGAFVPPQAPVGPAAPRAPQGPHASKVTIAPGMVESHIRSKLSPLQDHNFLPEKLLTDVDSLRRDYEKLRASYEVTRAIGVDLDVDALLAKVIDATFQLLPADRGVILLYEDNEDSDERTLEPRCVRTRKVQAQGEELVLSTTIIEEVLKDKAAVLSSDASVDSRFQGAHSIIMQGIRSSMAVPLLHGGEVFGIMMLDSQIAANAFTEKDLQLCQTIANQAAIAIQNSLYALKLEKEAITRERFQRLLSPAIAEQVIAGKVEVEKGGQVRETTVLFSDIRGFTAMSEIMDPREVVEMLNDYFERMVEIIFENEGTLDKFVGDEIMALYGAPIQHPDDPVRAVRTALSMCSALAEFNQERVAAGKPEVKVGIGINTGEVVAGYLGSSRALEYTVIGDTVNTGARLCSVAKAGEVIISEATHARVQGHFEIVELPPAKVKGKAKALRIFNVVGLKGPGDDMWDDHTVPR
ncbi:MAG: GAF domain-containing protein [Deltaproteobacteria bacterium]|nr:GAF domain-containing protein [Deltaproteobacteria bacterium]